MSCLIGFVDEEIKTEVDWSCNKFGGFPDWMLPGSSIPSCKVCTRKMYHVVQVYCPMEGSEYYRTLNVFACVNIECCNLHGSVSVLRSQKLEEKKVVEKEVEDDWGTNDWCGPPEENTLIDNASTENASTDPAIESHREDITSQLLQRMGNVSLNGPHFTPYYVYVQREDTLLTSEENPNIDYREYIDTKGGSNEDGKYEKTKVKHGDVAFYRMHKKLSKGPGQCLRYHYNGRPLLLSDISQPSIPLDEIPECPACKKPRVFEMQLLPPLVSQLRYDDVTQSRDNDAIESRNGVTKSRQNDVTSHNNDVIWEFGSVYVYTCSCWHGDVMEEVAVLHADPEHLMLQKIQS